MNSYIPASIQVNYSFFYTDNLKYNKIVNFGNINVTFRCSIYFNKYC